jgi:hypothetical protein
MGKEVKKPKEELAPSYFVQYSALWCILLGFFVMLLSFGKTQMGPGADGLGEVRDAFGTGGGLGLMPFARNVLFGPGDKGASSFRIRESKPRQIVEVDGYIRGMLWQKGLSNLSMVSVVSSDDVSKVILQIPVSFKGHEHLKQESVKFLEMLGEVLLDLQQYNFEVMVVEEDGEDPIDRQRNAMLRAAVVARFLTEISSLPPEHVRAVGYSDTRYIDAYGMKHVKGHILISIEKECR